MAAQQAARDDALSNLRLAIAHSAPAILSTSEAPTTDATDSLSHATHITFGHGSGPATFPLAAATRFAPGDHAIDLRSIYFAWLNKDASLPDYISAVQQLNEDLPSGAGGAVHQLSFPQKIELLAWLNGETETSDSIKPLEGAGLSVDAGKSAAIASGKAGGVAVDRGRGQDQVDDRLAIIYDGERTMGDHNTVLRGSKPVDFSQYRKLAQQFIERGKRDKGDKAAVVAPSAPLSNPLVSNMQKRKRLEPIILLSPSASSLLRMSNIKSFLNDGVYMPPNTTDSTATNLLQLNRTLPSISPQPLRFILVDSTQNFKPPYWARVVAIFTTGQPWQFKSYKYPTPAELFSHYPGIYVGYQGDEPPENVQAWGRGVLTLKVDKWTGASAGRWRDREVVETIWSKIEDHMKRDGWSAYGPGTAGSAVR